MRALAFWKTLLDDRVDFLDRMIALLADHHIRYCVISGQAVNAYAAPVVSVVAVDQIPRLETAMRSAFHVERFAHSLKVSLAGSDLRVQIQIDPRYTSFVDRATPRDALGLTLPVADVADLLQGKVWAAMDTTRRPSKRQKDLADISRLLESFPHLRDRVPAEILARLV